MAKNNALQSEVVIYTDGACSPTKKIGGWAVILMFEKADKVHIREVAGGFAPATNNQAEMMAVLNGLRILKRPCTIDIYSDSKYVVDGIGSWLDGKPRTKSYGWMVDWHRRGWVKKDGPLKNKEIWEQLHEEVRRHKHVSLNWVRGHNDNEHNERCDILAVEARRIIHDEISSYGLCEEGAANNSTSSRTTHDRVYESIRPLRSRNPS